MQERKRVHALKRLGIDYTSAEPSLDFITKLVTNVCGVPSAVITFIDQTQCYIKSANGIPTEQRSYSRSLSICSWVLAPLNPEVMVVEDMTKDERSGYGPVVLSQIPQRLNYTSGREDLLRGSSCQASFQKKQKAQGF